ncbi:TetR family transcriptional regulator [Arthrobacter sp. HMSC06H05]|uniref:AcrR family transcriptional regulator n=1 Tax=Pseudoglutamicibacter albus TaxID=98671 RepID=A0ABU1Z159_9MICC|nr:MULTISPECIES: TetR/AcrR family transcriptional regulator [Micrococcaceae]MDR7294344.1 AcrR family transcriptional regulator [Pseudoglutamicibacter albus]OFT42651.1 TetR family transcriptional regulator [Arthrobacter sp. HMSC06H05]
MHIDLEVFEPVDTTPVGHRVLDAASELFRDHGIRATGVDSIVERAETTKRTLYQRYGSKDRLVACYLQQRAHVWQGKLLEALTGASPAEALEVVYRHTARWATGTPRGCAFVNAWAEIGASEHEAGDFVRAEKAWMLALFTQIAGGDENTGALLHLLHEGAQVTASIQGDPRVFAQACAASQELLAQR